MGKVVHIPNDARRDRWKTMRDLFPAGVYSAFSDASEEAPPLFEQEAQSVTHAVPARKLEFALGRSCARAALAQFGVAATAIPVGEDRSPVWPVGFVGSITHCSAFVGAVVARTDHFEAIGFDVEPAVPLDPDLVRLVCTEAENWWMQGAQPPMAADWGKVFFAVKEAIHKCVAPRSGVILEFRDVEASLSPADGTFSALVLTPDYPTLPDFARILGRFAIGPAFVSTAAIIPATR